MYASTNSHTIAKGACLCTSLRAYACTSEHTHADVRTLGHTCTHVHHMPTYPYEHTVTDVHMHLHLDVHTYAHAPTCTHNAACLHTLPLTHTHKHTWT